MQEKIKTDVENGHSISDLKVQRNQGNLTPDVISMCSKHLDDMVENLKKCAKIKLDDKLNNVTLDEVVAGLKDEPKNLALMSTFMDDYDEVLKWNKLHHENKLPSEVTAAHREVDIAMFHSLCSIHDGKWASTISKLLYHYSRRNEENA